MDVYYHNPYCPCMDQTPLVCYRVHLQVALSWRKLWVFGSWWCGYTGTYPWSTPWSCLLLCSQSCCSEAWTIWRHYPSIYYLTYYVSDGVAGVYSSLSSKHYRIYPGQVSSPFTLTLAPVSKLESPIRPNVHVFGLWEKTKVPNENPHRYGENMQTQKHNTLKGSRWISNQQRLMGWPKSPH